MNELDFIVIDSEEFFESKNTCPLCFEEKAVFHSKFLPNSEKYAGNIYTCTNRYCLSTIAALNLASKDMKKSLPISLVVYLQA